MAGIRNGVGRWEGVWNLCIWEFHRKANKITKDIKSEYIFRMKGDQNKLYFKNLMNSTKAQIQKKKFFRSVNCLTTPEILCSNVTPLTAASDG